ncbi:MAG: RNB domain-containing ribonuclease [Frankiales bacterium]|nr:RNB domain-containing ribonuclease [Frankiales bacterium]
MPMRRTVISGGDLTKQLTTLRAELGVAGAFPADVVAEADAAASAKLPELVDATDLPLVTLDPPGSTDLDQAFFIARTAKGFDVSYAIADVASFVRAGGAVDGEARRRGETLYLPDGRVPLHPPVLSEGAASLLPEQARPAVLWRLALDADGEVTSVDVRRSLVRSRAQLDYPSFEQTGGDLVALLKQVGELRQERERARGGVSLPVPEQEVVLVDGSWQLRYRAPLPVEGWNAQLSLMTGMAAAKLMLDGGVGLLRVMPPPDDRTIGWMRHSARALRVDWPASASYADVVRGLDATVPAQAALLRVAQSLFRGAGYVAFDGTPPAETEQSAVAAPYAHATAPLRRLADRFVSECCLAACEGIEVPDWARSALPSLPELMAGADRHAHEVDRAVVDLAEALLLTGRVGEVFEGVVVDADDKRGEVQLRDPAVRARLTGDSLPLGKEVSVRLAEVDVDHRRVTFTLA